MRPLIGITSDHQTNRFDQGITTLAEAYTTAVAGAGGVPVLISSAIEQAARADLFGRLDGIVLAGGGDIDPAHYRSDYPGHYGRWIRSVTNSNYGLQRRQPPQANHSSAYAGNARS